MLVETIKSVLEEDFEDSKVLTARKIRESIEPLIEEDLAHMEEDIQFMLKSFQSEEVKQSVSGSNVNNIDKLPKPRPRKRRKQTFFSKSDDETDVDFDPKCGFKKKPGRPRKKSSS